MPTYDHKCDHCQGEFEEIYGMKDPIPSKCPLCQTEGFVKRLISRPSKGIVELSGQELKDHIQMEAAKTIQTARQNENFLANLVGEEKYQKTQIAKAHDRQEMRQIGKFHWGRRSS